MSVDLIDREALRKSFDRMARTVNCEQEWLKMVIDLVVREEPSVDPVHSAGACYCRECRFWVAKPNESDYLGYCDIYKRSTPDGGFCSNGYARKPSPAASESTEGES